MAKRKNFMTVSLDKGIDLYLSTLATEGKSPRYIDWLATRLRYFHNFIKQTFGEDYTLQDLTVEDGRAYMRNLMERDTRYQDHPMIKRKKGKLKIQYIHGCGRAVRSFSSWAYEEGYLEENVMQRLKLPKIPTLAITIDPTIISSTLTRKRADGISRLSTIMDPVELSHHWHWMVMGTHK
jgi:site-specific recombinase XerD